MSARHDRGSREASLRAARLTSAIGERMKRAGQLPLVHLSQFIDDQDGIARARRRALNPVAVARLPSDLYVLFIFAPADRYGSFTER